MNAPRYPVDAGAAQIGRVYNSMAGALGDANRAMGDAAEYRIRQDASRKKEVRDAFEYFGKSALGMAKELDAAADRQADFDAKEAMLDYEKYLNENKQKIQDSPIGSVTKDGVTTYYGPDVTLAEVRKGYTGFDNLSERASKRAAQYREPLDMRWDDNTHAWHREKVKAREKYIIDATAQASEDKGLDSLRTLDYKAGFDNLLAGAETRARYRMEEAGVLFDQKTNLPVDERERKAFLSSTQIAAKDVSKRVVAEILSDLSSDISDMNNPESTASQRASFVRDVYGEGGPRTSDGSLLYTDEERVAGMEALGESLRKKTATEDTYRRRSIENAKMLHEEIVANELLRNEACNEEGIDEDGRARLSEFMSNMHAGDAAIVASRIQKFEDGQTRAGLAGQYYTALDENDAGAMRNLYLKLDALPERDSEFAYKMKEAVAEALVSMDPTSNMDIAKKHGLLTKEGSVATQPKVVAPNYPITTEQQLHLKALESGVSGLDEITFYNKCVENGLCKPALAASAKQKIRDKGWQSCNIEDFESFCYETLSMSPLGYLEQRWDGSPTITEEDGKPHFVPLGRPNVFQKGGYHRIVVKERDEAGSVTTSFRDVSSEELRDMMQLANVAFDLYSSLKAFNANLPRGTADYTPMQWIRATNEGTEKYQNLKAASVRSQISMLRAADVAVDAAFAGETVYEMTGVPRSALLPDEAVRGARAVRANRFNNALHSGKEFSSMDAAGYANLGFLFHEPDEGVVPQVRLSAEEEEARVFQEASVLPVDGEK